MTFATPRSRARRIAGRSAIAVVVSVTATIVGVASPAFASATGSATLAGYSATPTNGVASATATFRVPTIDCTSGTTEGQFLGVGDPTTIDTGSGHTVLAAVFLRCIGTTPDYQCEAYVNQTFDFQTGVNPGDTVETSMFQTGTQEGAETLDLTNGQHCSDVTNPVPTTTIAAGLLAEGIGTPIAPFGHSAFSSVQINGHHLSSESPTKYKLASGATTLAKPSAIASSGASFTVRFEAS